MNKELNNELLEVINIFEKVENKLGDKYVFDDLIIRSSDFLYKVLVDISTNKDDEYKNNLANKLLSINENSSELFRDINDLFRTNYTEISLSNICNEGLWRTLSNNYAHTSVVCALIPIYLKEVKEYSILSNFMNIRMYISETTGKYNTDVFCDEPLGLIMSTEQKIAYSGDIRMIRDWCDKLGLIIKELNGELNQE
ncbi:MAG: hypothetical protein R3Y29_00670 [bacterium]